MEFRRWFSEPRATSLNTPACRDSFSPIFRSAIVAASRSTPRCNAISSVWVSTSETATGPTPTVQTPYVWGPDNSWKKLIFTNEQPFLEGEAYENWIKAKEKYRDMKAKGQV